MKLLLDRRESVTPYAGISATASRCGATTRGLFPRRPRSLRWRWKNCGFPPDAIIDDRSAPYPRDDGFELDELKTEGYASLLRIERGRLGHRDVFGPVRLHYGWFKLAARHSYYLIARRGNQVAGGIGYMIDEIEKAVRVFELISRNDAPIRFLVNALMEKCRGEGIEYVEADVSAYAPRMQRTMLELGFLPVSYVPANVFHEVERLDRGEDGPAVRTA